MVPTKTEATPLVAEKTGGPSKLASLGIASRDAWACMIVLLLFVGKGSMPFINDVLKDVDTSLMDDNSTGLTTTGLGTLLSARDMSEGLSKLLVGPVLWLIGLRNVWLLVLALALFDMLLVPTATSLCTLFVTVVLQAVVYAWVFPATTKAIAGWVDGHLLGKALGVISIATKITPSLMSPLYAELQRTSWRSCYYVSAGVAGVMLLLFFLLFRSSAKSLGFREPTPPGMKPGSGHSHLRHPLARESTLNATWIVLKSPRTWALSAAFCFLAILKGGSSFASIYAKKKLGVPSHDAANLHTTYNIGAVCAGIFGGVVYDLVPHGKAGIGVLMTCLNVLNMIGFIIAFVGELTDTVSITLLHVFMATTGFASVLPVSLPFQVYSMAVGGVMHCAVIVAIFEFVTHFFASIFDEVTGGLLESESFGAWLGIMVAFAFLGTVFMAVFYWLDWRRAPNASSLVAAPDLDLHNKKSIGRAMLFAAQQAETKEDIENAEKSVVVSLFSSKSLCNVPAQPSASTAQPSASTAQPSASTAQPSASTAQPSASTAQPSASTAQPSASPAFYC